MVIRSKKTATATRTRTAPPAAKKRTAPAPVAKKSVPAKKAVPAQRKAPAPAPAKKPAPVAAKKTATGAPTKRPVGVKPGSGAVGNPKTSVQAHDVLRAQKAAQLLLVQYQDAEANARQLSEAYWGAYNGALDGAVEHAAKMAQEVEKEVPKRTGRPATKEGPARKALAPEPNVAGEFYDIDVVKGYGIVQLRELANDLADRGIITERKIKGVIYDQMEEAGLFRQAGTSDSDADAEDDDEVGEEGEEDFEEYEDDEAEAADSADDESDDEDDDGGDDEDALTLDDLNNMDLAQLQEIAEEWGLSWKGLKQKEIIAKIVAASEGSEDSDEEEPEDDEDETEEYEDESADEEDDSDEEEDEEEEMELSMDDIEAMGAEELTALLEQLEIRVPAKLKNNADGLRDLLLENLEAQDDEEE